MARTTATLVKGILTEYVSGDDLTPYIDTANLIVTDECTASDYDDVRLELIERWLSAHCYAMDHRATQQEGVSSGPQESFQTPRLDLRLNNTTYGQNAVMLDTAGNLAAMDNAMDVVKKPLSTGGVTSRWLGTPRPWW